jgi:rod shape determining protein RodA
VKGRHTVSFRGGPHIDMPLLLVVVAIACIGVVNLYSATSAYLGAARHAVLADIYVSQIYWIVVGLLLGMLIAAIDYRHFERLAPVAYVGGLACLALVFVFATDVRGSQRWIRLGAFAFQPSEFMKPAVVLMVARWLQNDTKTEARTIVDLIQPALIAGVPTIAVMLQPDLGTSLIYVLSTVSILAITRIQTRSVVTVLGGGLTAAFLMFKFAMHDYQRGRITSFLDPEADKTGTGWHAFQAQTAIGNGGLFGEGFMQGTQNQFGFLPDQHSDFPFAVYSEEFGFAGCVALICLYCFLSIWSVHIASQAKDRFGAGLAIGVGAIVFWHAVFNIGMSIGVLPVVGVTLPLFSYGGSSVITCLVSLGMLMSVSMRR